MVQENRFSHWLRSFMHYLSTLKSLEAFVFFLCMMFSKFGWNQKYRKRILWKWPQRFSKKCWFAFCCHYGSLIYHGIKVLDKKAWCEKCFPGCLSQQCKKKNLGCVKCLLYFSITSSTLLLLLHTDTQGRDRHKGVVRGPSSTIFWSIKTSGF